MINPFKYVKHFIILCKVQFTINRNLIYGEKRVKLSKLKMAKYPVINVLKVSINGESCGILLTTHHKKVSSIVFIDLVWLNKKKIIDIAPEVESAYYQLMYEVFLRWYDQFILKKKFNTPESRKIAISLKVREDEMVEKFRRIITLHGFEMDPSLTVNGVEFKAPWRDKEEITDVIYSRII